MYYICIDSFSTLLKVKQKYFYQIKNKDYYEIAED